MSQKKSRQQKKPKSEIKLAEERFQSCVVKRNNFNDEARALRDERNALHDQRGKIMEEIMKHRDEMKSNTSSKAEHQKICLLYTSPSPRDRTRSRMPSSA